METFVESKELRVSGARAILVGIVMPDGESFPEDQPLDELAALAETAGLHVCERVLQKRTSPDPKTYCGKGKTEELRDLAGKLGANMLIFDNELKPSQQTALTDATGIRIMDRTELILAIFAEHARTNQAKAAVSLAQLEYQLPRLRNLWSHLERQRGSLSAVGGAGERQIEVDRRILRDRMHKLRTEIADIERRREVEVNRRSDLFQVALVGYTNAGKSTLMNALTDAGVYVADQLFATLDTRTRICEIGDHKLLLSDTVGFIRSLPHSLIAGFHATLAEAMHADLLLHVVDASHPAVDQMIATVNGVLHELEADKKRALLVLNKADRIHSVAMSNYLREQHPGAVLISARSGAGLTELKASITAIIEEGEIRKQMIVPAGNGKLLAFLKSNTKLIEERYEGEDVHVTFLVEPRFERKIDDLLSGPAR
ncbi:MAG: GTPase HflX [Planctomycetaceae bacterium]|nr:GTPase HflX [Planctomycetaceae bacterium]